jgi:hypothetical protein
MVGVGKAPQLSRHPAVELDTARPRTHELEIDFSCSSIVFVAERPVRLPMPLPQQQFQPWDHSRHRVSDLCARRRHE